MGVLNDDDDDADIPWTEHGFERWVWGWNNKNNRDW